MPHTSLWKTSVPKPPKRRPIQEPSSSEIINGLVANNIFGLQGKTTFIDVAIKNDKIETTLTDRGEVIFELRGA